MSSARVQRFAFGCIWAAAMLTIGVLALIIGLIVWRGLPSISWEFLTGSPENLGRDGGILPTIIGTMVLGLVALLIATPLGIGSAIYLTEYTYDLGYAIERRTNAGARPQTLDVDRHTGVSVLVQFGQMLGEWRHRCGAGDGYSTRIAWATSRQQKHKPEDQRTTPAHQ